MQDFIIRTNNAEDMQYFLLLILHSQLKVVSNCEEKYWNERQTSGNSVSFALEKKTSLFCRFMELSWGYAFACSSQVHAMHACMCSLLQSGAYVDNGLFGYSYWIELIILKISWMQCRVYYIKKEIPFLAQSVS